MYSTVNQKNIEKEIDELLTKGVGEFIDPDNVFREKLIKKAKGEYSEPIIIKFGIDPTRPDIHLGHAVVFRKLRKFQDIGCRIVFLVGDYTAQIGDPTGKSKARPEIELREVEENMKTFLQQIDKIIKVERDQKEKITHTPIFSWIRNSDWFFALTDFVFPENTITTQKIIDKKDNAPKEISVDANSIIGKGLFFEQTRMQKQLAQKGCFITLKSFLWTLKHITHAALIERDMFQRRIQKGEYLFMHEMMYPVLQGIDSHALGKIYGSCDLEVGGTDQTFNMLVGRDVMKFNNQEPQAVLSMHLLEGTDGKEKMSKSLDNYIGITDEPHDMFGKIMSIPDSSILNYFELCTMRPLEYKEKVQKRLDDGENPRDVKMELAYEIVALYHGEEEAKTAEQYFVETFQKGEVPEDVVEVSREAGEAFPDALVRLGVIESKSELRRLIEGGGVKNTENDEKIGELDESLSKPMTLKVGKRRFVKLLP